MSEITVSENAVVEYLAKLTPTELDSVVARARASSIPPAPPPAPAPEPIAFRATLRSVDLELIASPARPTPPPLPARATTPPPEPIVAIAVAPQAPLPSAPPIAIEPSVIVAPEMPTPAPTSTSTSTSTPTSTSTSPALTPAPAPALSSPDLTDLLFDAMTDLPFCDTAVEGGAYCLATVLRTLPSLAGIVSLFDADARELVIVYAQGPRADRLLLTRFAAGDALVARALAERGPIVESYESDGASTPSERHAAFGEPWSVLVAPVVRDGRLLGTIELVDPIDGAPFSERARDALRYVTSQWAELIAERGIRLPRLVSPPADAPVVS